MRYFILFVFCLPLIAGCSNFERGKEIRLMGQLKPNEESHYHLYSFWSEFTSENWEGTEENEDLRREFEIYSTFELPINKIRLYSSLFPGQNNYHEYIDLLGIEEFPTFVLLGSEGVVLKTSDADELIAFTDDLPDAFADQ